MKNHMEGPSSFPALLDEWVKKKYAKINYTDNYIEFFNRSKIHLCHCQYEKDVNKYLGAEIHQLLIDELTHFTEKIYRFLRGRVRLGGLRIPEQYAGRFPRILCATNPGGVGHNWVKKEFVDVAPPMTAVKMESKDGGMVRQFVPAFLADNPTLLQNDPEYAARLEGLGGDALVRAMLFGDWNIVAGGMFDDVFDPRIHVIPAFEIPKSWRIDRSLDWGSSKPFSVGWWAESDGSDVKLADGTLRSYPRGTLFRIAEWYGWNGRVNEGCKMLAVDVAKGIIAREKAWFPNHKVKMGPADGMIFNSDRGTSIADDMGKLNVHWTRADKSQGSRVIGWEGMRKKFKASFTNETPGLYIFNTCEHFVRTIPTLPRLEKNTDDVDSEAEDHIADEARYRIMTPRGEITEGALLLGGS